MKILLARTVDNIMFLDVIVIMIHDHAKSCFGENVGTVVLISVEPGCGWARCSNTSVNLTSGFSK